MWWMTEQLHGSRPFHLVRLSTHRTLASVPRDKPNWSATLRHLSRTIPSKFSALDHSNCSFSTIVPNKLVTNPATAKSKASPTVSAFKVGFIVILKHSEVRNKHPLWTSRSGIQSATINPRLPEFRWLLLTYSHLQKGWNQNKSKPKRAKMDSSSVYRSHSRSIPRNFVIL